MKSLADNIVTDKTAEQAENTGSYQVTRFLAESTEMFASIKYNLTL